MARQTGRHALTRSMYSNAQRTGHLKREVYSSALGVSAASVDALPPKKKLCCFVSGGGSNMRKIDEAIQDGRINGEITVRTTFSRRKKGTAPQPRTAFF